jgi:hypothetical protein
LPPELDEKEIMGEIRSKNSDIQPVEEIKRLVADARMRPSQVGMHAFNEDDYMDGDIDMETELLD